MTRLAQAPELTGRAWLGTDGRTLSLAGLSGQVVLLDFWTFCCVNCLHVLDELRHLEHQFPDTLVVVGVHSPKFPHEADPAALAAAVDRYHVTHPVLDDPELTTWQAYGARAWPTLVLIDPEGNLVAHLSGEGHGAALSAMIADLVSQHRAKGTLQPRPVQQLQPTAANGGLTFPSKAIALPSGQLLLADAGAHRLVGTSLEGRLVKVFGSGQRGLVNGAAATARFSEPNGLCLLPPAVASRIGVDVVVADTVNHTVRGLNLTSNQVTTLAGTGLQRSGARPGPSLVHGGAAALGCDLSSPWDVAWDPGRELVLIAMAGVHQIWGLDLDKGLVGVLAGTSGEGLVDGDALAAWLAQPSGLAVDRNGWCWFVDAETSALRYLDTSGKVETALGQGLFDFGLVDGDRATARLQHPLGLALTPGGQVLVADTYNGAIRLFDPASGQLNTVATDLFEPTDVLLHPELAPDQALVIESGGHRLALIQFNSRLGVQPSNLAAGGAAIGSTPDNATIQDSAAGQAAATVQDSAAGLDEPMPGRTPGTAGGGPEVSGGDLPARRTPGTAGGGPEVSGGNLPARRTPGTTGGGPASLAPTSPQGARDNVATTGRQKGWAGAGFAVLARPPLEIPAGVVDLEIAFTVPVGRVLDESAGYAIDVKVFASPPELLIQGVGTGHHLARRLQLAPGQGVLHVTARVATCGMTGDHPACYLNAQDWGVPITVTAGSTSPARIDLPLG